VPCSLGLGVLWWGLAAGQWLLARSWLPSARPVHGAVDLVAVLGRWSLSYYMLHQPVLIGALMALAWLMRH